MKLVVSFLFYERICYDFQYDVELYMRIEDLIGKKLPLYKTEENEVLVLQERVGEAQRIARVVSTSIS